MMAVVGAEDLHDRIAVRVGAGDADGVHRGLGTGVREAPLRKAEALGELVGDHEIVFVGEGEMRALREAVGDGLADLGVRVTLDHGAEAVVEIVVLVAIHVPDLRAR